ncbi:MAG TPA: hypothetical protein VJV21_02180 [Pyrinomonadaceae bacterium]|nr:hypothetical protein [Pyrinomonadaceae bacterium]
MKLQTRKPHASPMKFTVCLIPALLIFFSAACSGSNKFVGTFVGSATAYGGGYSAKVYSSVYGMDEIINDVTVTLTKKSATEYYLTFGEKSPIQCKLLVDNANLEDDKTDNDDDLSISRVRENRDCQLRGKDGQVQTAKVTRISGLSPGGRLDLHITLEATPSSFIFSYQGWKQK